MTAKAVEICIDASQESSARSALTAAYMGGADRVEVCASMDVDGTTPPRQRIRLARDIFVDRPGVIWRVRAFKNLPRDQNQNQRQSHLAISIVSVILIDMLIFDVPLGVIVQRQPAIGINTEEEKNEILHALDQSRSHAQENIQSHAQAQAQDQRFAHKSR